MSFLPPVVGCLLKKRLAKGGGVVTGTPGTLPSYTSEVAIPYQMAIPRLPVIKVLKVLSVTYCK